MYDAYFITGPNVWSHYVMYYSSCCIYIYLNCINRQSDYYSTGNTISLFHNDINLFNVITIPQWLQDLAIYMSKKSTHQTTVIGTFSSEQKLMSKCSYLVFN